MRLLDDRQTVVGFHVAVAPCKGDAEARHAPVQPLLIAQAESLPQPIADAARAERELVGNALANQQRRRHPLGGYSVGPRRLVLALSLLLFSMRTHWAPNASSASSLGPQQVDVCDAGTGS